MNRLLAVGLGYSALATAKRLAPESWRIVGTARKAEGLAAIQAHGYEAVLFDGETASPELAAALRQATHLLISAPPEEQGDPLLLHHRADLQAALDLRWIGYLSTIGVYGDHNGGWVDETTPPHPSSQRSHWRLEAERAWEVFAAPRGIPAALFRIAGIYGPGRNAIERLRAGEDRRISKPGQVFNRIHVADIAAAVEAALTRNIGGVFNLTDDEPAPAQDVTAYAAELLGVQPPPLIDWQDAVLTPMGRSFYMENKRVHNTLTKEALGIMLKYPTYREGLRALFASS